MKPMSAPLLAAGVAFWLWSALRFAEAAQPLCEIYEPAELLAHWGYPIEVELWVEDPYEAYRHANFYNYVTGGRGVDREELQPLAVPYRVGALTIVSADAIEWHVEPAVVASAHFLSRTTRIGIEYDDRIGINWKHIGWRPPLPAESLEVGNPLFPLAVLFDLIEEGFVPKVNGLSGQDIDDAVGFWIMRDNWVKTQLPPKL